MAEKSEIPEDLLGRHIELTRWQFGPLNEMQMPWQCSLQDELKLIERIATLTAERDTQRESKDTAYSERDRLVCALSKLFPSHIERHPESDVSWEDDWRWIVFIQLPTGQASWHIHDTELPWFDHLERREGNTWDGHTTSEKYCRIERIKKIDGMSNITALTDERDENARLKAQLARHEAPVSDEEWGQREELEDNRLWRKGFDRIIEARANPDSMGHNMQGMTPNYDRDKPQKEESNG